MTILFRYIYSYSRPITVFGTPPQEETTMRSGSQNVGNAVGKMWRIYAKTPQISGTRVTCTQVSEMPATITFSLQTSDGTCSIAVDKYPRPRINWALTSMGWLLRTEDLAQKHWATVVCTLPLFLLAIPIRLSRYQLERRQHMSVHASAFLNQLLQEDAREHGPSDEQLALLAEALTNEWKAERS